MMFWNKLVLKKCLMKLFGDVGRLVLEGLVFVRKLLVKVLIERDIDVLKDGLVMVVML